MKPTLICIFAAAWLTTATVTGQVPKSPSEPVVLRKVQLEKVFDFYAKTFRHQLIVDPEILRENQDVLFTVEVLAPERPAEVIFQAFLKLYEWRAVKVGPRRYNIVKVAK